MEKLCKLKIRIPKEIAEKYGLTEHSRFDAYFDGENIYLKTLAEEEFQEKQEVSIDDEQVTFIFEDGRSEGLFIGYRVGYRRGFNDAKREAPFNSEYPGDDEILEDSDCSDHGCEECEHFCHHCGRCMLED
ncbi:MAG: AbrB/MazE/SpoVT family DNA-binding domain-containing protein [Clostridia bacterium]|nr:AbrB/MazE/SpoVT family DNA-binding domain-containing protein [Clostridia bacterium]